MTLVEVMVVMVIIGLGWFYLVPNLDLGRQKEDKTLEEVNLFLGRVQTRASQKDLFQDVYLKQGASVLTWEEQRAELPAPAISARLNGEAENPNGLKIKVYPSRVLDHVRLVLSNGQVLTSVPLMGEFRIANE
jgi:type II secretory pathway pseudopilin PulG